MVNHGPTLYAKFGIGVFNLYLNVSSEIGVLSLTCTLQEEATPCGTMYVHVRMDTHYHLMDSTVTETDIILNTQRTYLQRHHRELTNAVKV